MTKFILPAVISKLIPRSGFYLAACRLWIARAPLAIDKNINGVMDYLGLMHVDYHTCVVLIMEKKGCFIKTFIKIIIW